jgi:hypothetical protein
MSRYFARMACERQFLCSGVAIVSAVYIQYIGQELLVIPQYGQFAKP